MTKSYFWNTLGRYEKDINDLKLLDSADKFRGERKQVKLIYEAGYEKAAAKDCPKEFGEALSGCCLNQKQQHCPLIRIRLNYPHPWIRVIADVRIKQKEWDIWKMTQMIVLFKRGNQTIQQNMIRIQRILNDQQTKTIFMDAEVPKKILTALNFSFGMPMAISLHILVM